MLAEEGKAWPVLRGTRHRKTVTEVGVGTILIETTSGACFEWWGKLVKQLESLAADIPR